jgi:asparagine synthase (glutamine-hydrolysing)
MCGIVGFVGQFEEDLLTRMNAALAHRGPDDSGIWFDPAHGIGLAHRRLSIIDLSPLGHQPMWDASHTAVIVFNGEIYNYRELRQSLVDHGCIFNSHSDTEVLLNLYLRDGIAMLTRLNGMFAFALWDTRTRELFLARDGVGVKPLYYTENQQGVLFASELKAILDDPSVDRTIDPLAIQSYLTYLWCPAPRTPLQTVKKLEPGHALLVKDDRIHKYWQFYDLPYHQPLENLSVVDAIEQAQHYLKQAVQRQMVADVPVGTFLSGGLDSSAVTTFAQQALVSGKLQCFTIGFQSADAVACDGMTADLPYAQQVARHLGVDLHTIYVGAEMIDHLERMIYCLDEPQADPAPINALFISQLAREYGIKVLLSGAGGDDIFTGYRRHFALMQERYWDWLPRPVRRGIAAAARALPVGNPLSRRLSKGFQYANLAARERLVSYFFWLHPDMLPPLYGPLLRESLRSVHPASLLLETLRSLPDTTLPLNQMLYVEGKHFLCDHNLNYTDKMGMAVGVEARVPLLDPDLIALAARLPLKYKQHGRIGKWIFKKAMEPYLPHNVIYRPKTGFGAPLRYWLKHQLRPVIEDVLSESSLNTRGLFDPIGVHKLIALDRQGKVDTAYTIFSILCIELWCRIFLDGKARLENYSDI